MDQQNREPGWANGTPSALPMLSWSDGERAERLSTAFRENRTAMYMVARRICGTDTASDVVQDVFLRVWRDSRFDPGRASMRSYLLVMTRGVAIDTLRSQSASKARDDRHGLIDAMSLDDEAANLLATETRSRVEAALQVLTTKEREVMVGAFYEHMTYRQIADRLSIPEGTVKSRARLAMIKLRHQLREFAGDPSMSTSC